MTEFRKLFERGVRCGVATALVLGAASASAAPVGTDLGPSSAAGSYLAGRFAQAHEDWATASMFLEHVLAADPANVQLLRRAFVLQLGQGRFNDALISARKLAERDPTAYLPAVLLAAEDLAAGRTDAAAKRMGEGLSPEGLGQFVIPLTRAWILAAAGQPGKAVETIAPLRETQGFAPLHDLQVGLIHEISGDKDAAAEAYERAVDGGAGSLRVVQIAASFHARNGQIRKAREAVEAFRQANPGSQMVEALSTALAEPERVAPVVTNPREGLAEALFDLASAMQQDGIAEMAMLHGRIALFLKPDFPLARLMAGDILASRDRPTEALAEFRQVGGDPALRWLAQLREAEQLARLDRKDEAIALLTEMAAARPERTDALVALGDLHRSEEKLAEAAESYGQAIARLPAQPEPRHWAIFYARGVTYERMQQWDKAEADLKRALELNPDQPLVLNYLGYSWVDRGLNLPEARALIEKAVALRPSDGYIVDSLGWVLYRLGDFEGAVRHLEKAVELRPLDATINDHLGDAYWQVGRDAEARFQWQRALRAAEEDKQKAEIQAKLDHGLPRPQTAQGRSGN